MPSLSGATSSTTAGKTGSTAPCSATKAPTDPQTSYAKRMRLLIASGLIAGITPSSERKRSAQRTLDFAFSEPGGDDAEERKAGS